MLNKFLLGIAFYCFVFLLSACGNEEEELGGEDILNYPDIVQLLNKEWNMDTQCSYLRVDLQNGKKDSTRISTSEMPWEEIKSFYAKANILNEALNHHYQIDLLNDSATSKMTFVYKSLVKDDYTNSISIVTNGDETSLNSLYIETREGGMKGGKRVLFVPNTLWQVIDRTGSGPQATTYYFVK